MPTVWKDILYPGTYRLRDGRAVTFTPADVENACRVGKRMRRSALAVPGVWEHDLDAQPVYLSEAGAGNPDWPHLFARNVFGHVLDYDLRDGVLWAECHIDDPADAAQFKKTRFVSPRVDYDYVDERGVLWPGMTVSHLAATPKPVQRQQKPVALSQAAAGPGGRRCSRDTYFLSELTREGTPVADKSDDTPDTPAADSDEGGVGGTWLKALIEALREKGFNIPDEVVDAEGLIIAVKASDAGPGGPDEGFPEEVPSEGGPTQAGTGAPMLMSQTAPAEPAEPAPMPERVVAGDRRELVRRVDGLFRSGRIDGTIHRDLSRKATGASLSYTAAGDLQKDALVTTIEAYERLPKGQVWTARQRTRAADLSVVAVPPPAELLGGADAAEREAAAAMEEASRKYSVERVAAAK